MCQLFVLIGANQVETVPCSRVGHIFRSFSPYQWETDKRIPEYNYKRVAAVWMDDWAHLYWDRLKIVQVIYNYLWCTKAWQNRAAC